MQRLIKGLMNGDSRSDRSTSRKHRDDKSSQTASQSRLSRLKQPQAWIPVALFVLIVFFLILFKVEYQASPWKVDARDWTGFGESKDENALEVTEVGKENTSSKITTKTTTTTKRLQSAKTLWDWMTLLLAPATLALLGFLFQWSQEKAKREKDELDKARDREKDELDRARDKEKDELDKARDADQQREQALQTYFDQLSALLVDKQLKKLLPAKNATVAMNVQIEEGANASNITETVATKSELSIDAEAALDVVKARTLSLLRMFDQDIPRKASVLSFLADADLLNQLDLDLSGISLEGANLKKVNFSACTLRCANLQNTDLSGTDLSGANLCNANLHSANLSSADLSGTDLNGANLSGANLYNANISGANLYSADLSNAKLGVANLSGADLSNAKLDCAKLSFANLSGSDLYNADLSNANLDCANLSKANLRRSVLRDADLRRANLQGAYLSDARFWDAELTDADLDRAKRDAVANIQSATNWQVAHYDPEMRGLLGLPPETSEDQNTAV